MKKHATFTTISMLLAFVLVSNLLVTPAQAATDSSAGSVLTLDLEASESVTIVANGANYTFTLNGTTWTGTDDANVTGNGADTLTVVADAFTDINISDSGTGASVIFGDSGVINTYSDSFTIVLDEGSGTVTVANSTSFVGGSSLAITASAINLNASVSTDNDSILLSADAMTIAAAVNAGTDIVTLQPSTAGQLIDLGGADAAGTLGLTDAEIDLVTAGILRIGSSNAGNISFTDTISPAGTDTLSLITGNEIADENNGADVQVANLALQTVNGVADNTPVILDMEVGTIAVRNTGTGGISILEVSNGGDLTVGTVDGVVGIRNEASTGSAPTLGIQLETTNGDLTVNADIFNQRRNIFLVAQQGNGGNGDRTFINNANISAAANNSQIRIDANNMTLAGGSTVSAPNRVILEDDPSASVPIAINLGGGDGANALGLTDAELDTVSTNGTLQIGHTNGGGTGDIAVTASIDLTDGPSIPTTELISGAAIDGSSGNVLTANILNLTAGTTIGSNGDPFAVNATELTTAGSGDQVLSEVDSVTIGDADLDADTGNTIQLAGGTFLTTSDGAIQNDTSVLTGATLGGVGVVNGTVTALGAGAVAPGASPGILNTGDVNLTAGSNLNVEVNGVTTAGTDYDQLNVTGTVDIDSAANLLTSGTVSGVPNGTTIVIIDNDDVDAVSGTFAGLLDGATVTINGQAFRISYSGGDGNDVVLVENTAPSLTTFARQTPATSPTNADSLVFRAIFSEDVQNVDAADFAVDGTTTAMVTDVSPVSASVYDVTVSGGDLADFNGLVGLDLSGAQDIQDLVGNALPAGEPATDETYTVENSAPEISGLTLLSPTGTITDTQPTFSWTAATDTGSGVVSYTLQLTLGSDIQEFSVSGTSYSPTTDLVAGDYTWTVKAHDAAGNVSEFVSPAASFTLEPSSSSDYQLFLPLVVKNN